MTKFFIEYVLITKYYEQIFTNLNSLIFRFVDFEMFYPSEHKNFEKVLIHGDLNDIHKTVQELTPIRSVDYIQTLIFNLMKSAANSYSKKDKIALIIMKIPSVVNFSTDQFKEFVIIQMVRVCVYLIDDICQHSNLAKLLKKLVEESFFARNVVIKALLFLAKYMKLMKNIDRAILSFAEEFKNFFDAQTLTENDLKKVKEVENVLKKFLRNEKFSQEVKENFMKVFAILRVSGDVNEITTEVEEISESFKILIQMIKNDEQGINKSVSLKHHELEVKFFLKFALKNIESACKFAKVVPLLFHNDPCGAYLFKELLMASVEASFLAHHHKDTKGNFTEAEVSLHHKFMIELVFHGYLPERQMHSILDQVESMSSGYSAIISIVMDAKTSNRATVSKKATVSKVA